MWTKWSDCSHTCGGGIQLRERDCVAPKYMKDMFCDNDKKESRLCRSEPCPSKSYLVASMISSLVYFLMITQTFYEKSISYSFQLMENSVIGRHGHHVRSHVESASRIELACAMRQSHNLAVNHAQSKHWAQVWRALSAIWPLVQVMHYSVKGIMQ